MLANTQYGVGLLKFINSMFWMLNCDTGFWWSVITYEPNYSGNEPLVSLRMVQRASKEQMQTPAELCSFSMTWCSLYLLAARRSLPINHNLGSKVWTLTLSAASRPSDRWSQSCVSSRQIIHFTHTHRNTHTWITHSNGRLVTGWYFVAGKQRALRQSQWFILTVNYLKFPCLSETLCGRAANWKKLWWSLRVEEDPCPMQRDFVYHKQDAEAERHWLAWIN